MTRRESACVVESPGSVTPAPPAWPIRLPDLKVCESAVQVSVLRSWRAGAAQCDALSRAFALPWPVQPNTVAGDAPRVLWLAPSEWAILDAPAAVVAARVAQASPHWLRHTFATHAIETVAPDVVGSVLGHASMATTTLYTRTELRRKARGLRDFGQRAALSLPASRSRG